MAWDSLVRDSLIVGVPSLIFLSLLGAVLALLQGRSPVPFLLKLGTDPFWLFATAIAVLFTVGGYRRAKQEQERSS